MLHVKDLALTRGDQRFRFEFELPAVSRLVVSGPSGAGKSTLLDLIAGFEMPDSGTLTWNGENLLDLEPADRPVSFLFQADNLFAHLTVAQNVMLGVTTRFRPTAQQKQCVAQVLDQVGLGGLARRRPEHLSGGQRQRVAIARCLLRDKPLLLLDEPFSALDVELRDEITSLLNSVACARGWTALLVSHDPESLEGFATHRLKVVDGIGANVTRWSG